MASDIVGALVSSAVLAVITILSIIVIKWINWYLVGDVYGFFLFQILLAGVLFTLGTSLKPVYIPVDIGFLVVAPALLTITYLRRERLEDP